MRVTARGHDGRAGRAAAVATLVLVVIVLLAAPADAHATLTSTSPAPSAVLVDAPAQVSITFDGPVDTTDDSLRVVDETGERISGPVTVDGSSVIVDVPDDVSGWFAVSWQIVSTDGHPLSGGWTYRVGGGADVAPDDLRALAEETPTDTGTELAATLAQCISALASLALVGTAFVSLSTPTVSAQREMVPYLVGLCVVGSALAAGLDGPATEATRAWFDGPASEEYVARGALSLVGGTLLWSSWSRRGARVAAGVLLAAGTCATVLAGHARSDGPGTVIVVMAHLVLAGAWLGALPALLVGCWRADAAARATLVAFSRAAVWLAGAVVVLGSVGAWALSGGPGSIAARWGWTLGAKVSLVVLAIVVGGWMRSTVLPDWTTRTRRQVRVPLLGEAAILAAVAAASIALTHNGPPDRFVAASPVELTTTDDDVTVTAVLDAGEVGTNDWHLYVTDPTGLPLDVEDATIELSSSELGIAPIVQELSDLGAGHFSGRTDDIGAAGTWEVRVVVRPTPFTQVEIEDSIEIG